MNDSYRETGETVDALGPDDHGLWLVRTRRSSHLWDLDAGTYTRLPGDGSTSFEWDGVAGKIAAVRVWPQVGERSYVIFDDPELPWLVDQWRVSSRIRSIERVEPV